MLYYTTFLEILSTCPKKYLLTQIERIICRFNPHRVFTLGATILAHKNIHPLAHFLTFFTIYRNLYTGRVMFAPNTLVIMCLTITWFNQMPHMLEPFRI